MKEIYSDVNIIGGGLIGSITAYSLSRFGLSISILEKKSTFKKKKYTDYRTTAISEGTKNFLESINIWKDIQPFSQPIKSIKVIDRKFTNNLNFDNKRRGSNLGYIVENKHLINIFYSKLNNNSKISIFNNVYISDFEIGKDKIITNAKNIKIVSDLNVASDGKRSSVKEFFKTPHFIKNYKKTALVLTINHTEDHHETAFEFFYKNGPLAILPMQKNKNEYCSAIVWTNNNQYMKDLNDMNNEMLISILEDETKHCIGKIKKILSKQTFPISAHLNSRFFERRTIYLGDSAHSLHPIAGQGWNLGMNAVENFSNLVREYTSLGIDLGDRFFCKKYHDNNFYNAYRLYQVTDKLDNIFKMQSPLVYFARTSGLNYINKNEKVKNMISDFAMGIN